MSMFDKLLVLAGGEVAFFGPVKDAFVCIILEQEENTEIRVVINFLLELLRFDQLPCPNRRKPVRIFLGRSPCRSKQKT